MYNITCFSETCRCPRELNADWKIYIPYTVMTNQSIASGIISAFLTNMVKEVCGVCPSHGHTATELHSTQLTSSESVRKRSIVDTTIIKGFDLMFPEVAGPEEKLVNGYNYIPVVQVPGFVLMTVKRSQASVYAQATASSLFDRLSYFLIYISVVMLSGIVIWILVGNHTL